MQSKTKSISGLIKRCTSIDEAAPVIVDWFKRWERDHATAMRRLEAAISEDDYDQMCIYMGALKKLSIRKFTGLKTISEFMVGTIVNNIMADTPRIGEYPSLESKKNTVKCKS